MNIKPISYTNANSKSLSFSSKGNLSKILKHKRLGNQTKNIRSQKMNNATICNSMVDKILSDFGFTYCKSDGSLINLSSGYQGGFYSIKQPSNIPTEKAKHYVAENLIKTKFSLGGLLNYAAFVKDIKRQDIIRKALKLHTYELNTEVDTKEKEFVSMLLSKYLKKEIEPKNLFYFENSAVYYDIDNKTAYSINLYAKTMSNLQNSLKVCKFEVDERGNAIGYKLNLWDNYKWKNVDIEYIEQQKPSLNLSPVVEYDNNEMLAEAFRFGNSKAFSTAKRETVLEHLRDKVKIQNVSSDNLQYIKFYDSNQNIQRRIAFYDSATGRSLVYNTDGKYIYQMEYNKDLDGNITSCLRI